MDIGGFTGNPTPSLFAKWIQIGAFNPYFRNHTAVNTKSAEPWTFGEEVLEISRNYINLRYKLLPYLYSTFYEATQNGHPVMRSLAIDYTFDQNIYNEQFQNQYLFGSAFLVMPFEGDAKFGKVYFPQGKWYDLYKGSVQNGGEEKIIQLSSNKLPVYVKQSSIIPMQSLVQSTSQKPTDTLVVNVYQGEIPNKYIYYEDDGESYAYENGGFYKRTISYDPAKKAIVFDKVEGSAASKFNNLKVILHGFGSTKKGAWNDDFVSYLTPISKFDPQGNANPVEGEKVKSMVIKNNSGQFTINY
jgi:alpha-glucosidase